MTEWLDVSSTTPRIAYTATASQTIFVVPFVFFEDTNLLVYQNDVILTLDTDYTVTGAEDEDGGTVTFATGATVGDSIVIARHVTIEQTTHIPPSGPLDVPAINIQISRIIAMLQEVADSDNRSIRQPDSDTDDIEALPAAASRALQYLAFDSAGNPIAGTPADTSTPISSVMQPVVAAATLALARALFSVRTVITSNLAFYVNSSTGSDSNAGTLAAPFLTLQGASDYIQRTLDLAGRYRIDVYAAEGVGNYAPLSVIGPYVGDLGGQVIFHGSLSRTITAASNTTPIVITSAAHAFTNGMHVVISGVTGNTAANGAYIVGSASTDTFALLKEIDSSNTTGNGAYVSGGIVASPRNCVIAGGSSIAVNATFGANFAIGGFGITSSGNVGMAASRGGEITTAGPIDFGACLSIQCFASRRGYIEMDYNFSISGGGSEWAQASHGGEVRKIAAGYFTASVSYTNFGDFVSVDNGEIVETGTSAFLISGATNATPIVITTTTPHGYANGDIAIVQSVTGNTAANGAWRTASVTSSTYALINPTTGANSAGNGAYVSGGASVGPPYSWNLQGFTVPASGSVRQYLQYGGAIQVSGRAAPPPNYYPGNSDGIAYSGTGVGDAAHQSVAGQYYAIIAGQASGFIVYDYTATTALFQVLNSGLAELFYGLGIGATPNTTTFLNLAAGTTAKSSLTIMAGTAPSSPTDGQIWYDGTNIKMRVGGTTKTFTLT